MYSDTFSSLFNLAITDYIIIARCQSNAANHQNVDQLLITKFVILEPVTAIIESVAKHSMAYVKTSAS